jgi:phosphoribosyl 1,2-cyclic phosphate phosphodiesterase
VEAILLGTGGAWPIPRPGCGCPQCAEARATPALARTRSGLYVAGRDGAVLVDAGPDVARQLEARGAPTPVDRVVLTHRHLDHVLGLDDVVHCAAPCARPLPVHVGEAHREKLGVMFRHLLREPSPRIEFAPWESGARIDLGDVVLEGFETGHRDRFSTTGVLLCFESGGRPRRVAYATDMGEAPPSPADRLRGVDLFVGDGTYLARQGYGHPGTTRMLEMARALGARRVAVTHVGHWGVALADAAAQLPGDVAICQDGDDLRSFLDA